MQTESNDARTQIFEKRAAMLTEASPKERRLLRHELETLLANDPIQQERQRCLDVLAIHERALGVLHLRLWNMVNSGKHPVDPLHLKGHPLADCPPELRERSAYHGIGVDPRD